MIDTTFNTNWNGKLNCNCFTTIRIANPKKYAVNTDHKISLKDEFLYNARVLAYKELFLHELNDFMSFVDTGYSRLETREIIYKMYPKIDFHTQKICFVLFGRNPTQTKHINKTPILKGYLLED
jgi:hypothetical protein